MKESTGNLLFDAEAAAGQKNFTPLHTQAAEPAEISGNATIRR
jgi:hypothetical protein